MQIDHVVLAARSREEAERALHELGLGIARGKILAGFGLSNLVVPLGRSSLEIHYPNGQTPDPALPPIGEIQREALNRHPDPLLPVAWLIGYEDEAELRRRAGLNDLPVTEVPEEGPGYPPYVLAGFGPNLTSPWLPAFVHWPVPLAERPHALTAPHTRRPTDIVGLDVAGPPGEIEQWCGGLPEVVHRTDGTAGPLRVHVGFQDGSSAALGPDRR